MSKTVYEVVLFILSTTIVALEAGSPQFQAYKNQNGNKVHAPVRPIMGSSRNPVTKPKAVRLMKKHDVSGSGNHLADGVYEFLTPWPYKFITNTTHPLMVKILLVVVAPILCVLIAMQAYVTYFGPSNSYDGSWTKPLSPPGEPGIAGAG